MSVLISVAIFKLTRYSANFHPIREPKMYSKYLLLLWTILISGSCFLLSKVNPQWSYLLWCCDLRYVVLMDTCWLCTVSNMNSWVYEGDWAFDFYVSITGDKLSLRRQLDKWRTVWETSALRGQTSASRQHLHSHEQTNVVKIVLILH